MEETKILFETAKLAIEKGYKEIKYHCALLETENAHKCNGNGAIKNKMVNCGECANQRYYSTQSLLQQWLRNIHKIHIGVCLTVYTKKYCYFIDFLDDREWEGIEWEENMIDYDTYEEALEIGLVEALKLIKNI